MRRSDGAEQDAVAREGLPAGLYPRLMGEAWPALAEGVRRMHHDGDVVRGTGILRVRHGTERLARALLRLLRLPAAADAVRIYLVISREGRGERWLRWFGGQLLESTQHEGDGGLLAEQVGPLEFRFRLEAEGGALCYRLIETALCLGPVRLRLPERLAPKVVAREAPDGVDRVGVEVRASAPGAGLLIAYDGWLRIEDDPR